MEVIITGANAITSPYLHIWDWRVAIYLFLGGLAAGCMVMSAIANLRPGKSVAADKPCCWRVVILAPILLNSGMFFLFLDLEAKHNMLSFYTTLQPLSPMSWGSWLLLLIFPAMIAYAFSVIPEENRNVLWFKGLIKFAEQMSRHLRLLAKINFVLGIILGLYTGVLLSSFAARPLWNSSILPILFLNSALSTGAATMILMAHKNEVKLFFTKVDIWLISCEIVVIGLLFYGHYTSAAAARESIIPFFTMSHEYFPYFVSIIALSVIFPLAIVLKYMEMTVTDDHSGTLSFKQKLEMNVSAILVLLGGAIIRFAFVYAGQLSKFTGLS